MARRRTGTDGGRRNERRRAFWLVPLVIVVVAVGAGLVWVFRFRLERLFEPSATLPPPPPTASGEEGGLPEGVFYQTDFDGDAHLDDWEPVFDDGVVSAQFDGSQLVVGINAMIDTGTWLALNYSFEDFVLEVDATRLSGPDDNGIFVLFRMTDAENYNRFDISSDGYYTLSMVRDGLPIVVSDYNVSPAILPGEAVNHITIRAEGDAFNFAVNGQELALCTSEEEGVRPVWSLEGECLGAEETTVWQNDDFSQGTIGLGAQAFSGFDGENSTPAEAVIGFDNLVIMEP